MEVENAASAPTRLAAGGTPSTARGDSAGGLASAAPPGRPAVRSSVSSQHASPISRLALAMTYVTLLVFTSILLLALRAVAWNQYRQTE